MEGNSGEISEQLTHAIIFVSSNCGIFTPKNLNLSTYLASDSLLFADVLAIAQPPCTHPSAQQQPALRPIVDLVGNALEKSDREAVRMIILDDITSLEWIGFSTLDLIRFSRALCALCRKVLIYNRCNLISS
jgi:hypothetical protein